MDNCNYLISDGPPAPKDQLWYDCLQTNYYHLRHFLRSWDWENVTPQTQITDPRAKKKHTHTQITPAYVDTKLWLFIALRRNA